MSESTLKTTPVETSTTNTSSSTTIATTETTSGTKRKANRAQLCIPRARIKKIMQADDDVGRIAQSTPPAICRALELFLELLLKDSMDITKEEKCKMLTAIHIKKAILKNEKLDFLKDLVEDIPDKKEKKTKANENNNATTVSSTTTTTTTTSTNTNTNVTTPIATTQKLQFTTNLPPPPTTTTASNTNTSNNNNNLNQFQFPRPNLN